MGHRVSDVFALGGGGSLIVTQGQNGRMTLNHEDLALNHEDLALNHEGLALNHEGHEGLNYYMKEGFRG